MPDDVIEQVVIEKTCRGCGFKNPVGGLKSYGGLRMSNEGIERVETELCEICRNTLVGNTANHHYEDAIVLQTIAYIGNLIRKDFYEQI